MINAHLCTRLFDQYWITSVLFAVKCPQRKVTNRFLRTSPYLIVCRNKYNICRSKARKLYGPNLRRAKKFYMKHLFYKAKASRYCQHAATVQGQAKHNPTAYRQKCLSQDAFKEKRKNCFEKRRKARAKEKTKKNFFERVI